jgi:protein-disulfide isomerase
VFKDFPLAIHELARTAHEAARCAASVGKYGVYRRRLFDEQPRLERDDLVRYAVELGLDRERFVLCLDGHTFAAAVDADIAEARALGIRSTPSFLINGRLLVGAHPLDTFRDIIDDALRPGR